MKNGLCPNKQGKKLVHKKCLEKGTASHPSLDDLPGTSSTSNGWYFWIYYTFKAVY